MKLSKILKALGVHSNVFLVTSLESTYRIGSSNYFLPQFKKQLCCYSEVLDNVFACYEENGKTALVAFSLNDIAQVFLTKKFRIDSVPYIPFECGYYFYINFPEASAMPEVVKGVFKIENLLNKFNVVNRNCFRTKEEALANVGNILQDTFAQYNERAEEARDYEEKVEEVKNSLEQLESLTSKAEYKKEVN